MVEDDLMRFTSYIKDLSSANFEEEEQYFNKKSDLFMQGYLNRVLSSKFKYFKEIQGI